MSDTNLERLLREARQYVVCAGSDEDPEASRNSTALLVDIDAALASPDRTMLEALIEIQTMDWAKHNQHLPLFKRVRAAIDKAKP